MHARTSALLSLLAALAWPPAAARAAVLSEPTASIPQTPTNWDRSTPALGGVDPLTVSQFDPKNGTLNEVDLTFHTQLSLGYDMGLVTPGTAVGSVATGLPDTPGPTVTLYKPDGITPLITAQSPSEASLLTNSFTYASGSAQQTDQSGPLKVDRTYTLKLTNPADLALFTGTGTVGLPVSASAVSMVSVSSGNGFGGVSTKIGTDLSVSYQYTPASAQQELPAPEPAGLALWALGGLGLWAARRRSRRHRPARG